MNSESTSAIPHGEIPFSRPPLPIWVVAGHLALILIVGFLLFRPSLQNAFVFNDIPLIANNPALAGASYISSIFSPDGAANAIETGYYTPVTNISYAIDYRMHSNPVNGLVRSSSVHATTLILYLLVCLLAYGFILLLTRRLWLAALSAALFLVHPMHVENVNYVATRGETLAALFLLAFLFASIPRPRSISMRVILSAAACFFALFAMLSSPVGLAAPLLLLLADWARRSPGENACAGAAWRYTPVIVALAVWAGLNLFLFGTLAPVGDLNAYAESAEGINRILIPFQVLNRYILMTIFPYPLTLIYHSPLVNGTVALAVVILLVFLAFLLLRKLPHMGFGLLFLIAGLLPIAVYSPWQTLIAESRLLLPSLGLCLLIAAVIFRIADATKPLLEGSRNTVAAILAVSILALFAAIGWNRQPDWKNGISLWTAELERNPNDELSLASLGVLQFQRGEKTRAEETLRKAVENYQTLNDVYYHLAFVLVSNRKLAEAEKVLDQATDLKGANGEFFSNLGLLYESMQEWDKAVAAYNKGVQIDPSNPNVRFNLGNVLMTRKEFDKAIEEYTKGMEQLPESAHGPFLVNRSIAYRRAGKLDEAMADAQQIRKSDPFEPRAYTLAAATKVEQSRALTDEQDPTGEKRQKLIQEAVETLQEGTQNIPTPNTEMLLTLSHMQFTLGYPEQAVNNARRAAQINPNDLKTQIFLGTLLIATNQFDEVGRHYYRVMNQVPGGARDPRVLASLGYAFFQKGQFEDARKLCEESLKISKRNAMGLLLYRRLIERNIPVNVDLSDVPATPIFPAGVPTPDLEEFSFDEPVELGTP